VEAVGSYLRKGNKPESGSLHAAIYKRNREIVKLLIEYGADLNDESVRSTPLEYYILAGEHDPEILRMLIESGADVNHLGWGRTPVQFYWDDLCGGYMSQHPSVTPLMLADSLGTLDILLPRVNDVNAKDVRGATALMYAIENNIVSKVKKLLQHGAETNMYSHLSYNKDKWEEYPPKTPLSCALDGFWWQHEEMVNLLLANAADPTFQYFEVVGGDMLLRPDSARLTVRSVGLLSQIDSSSRIWKILKPAGARGTVVAEFQRKSEQLNSLTYGRKVRTNSGTLQGTSNDYQFLRKEFEYSFTLPEFLDATKNLGLDYQRLGISKEKVRLRK
jgi:ankyrin repeat protein